MAIGVWLVCAWSARFTEPLSAFYGRRKKARTWRAWLSLMSLLLLEIHYHHDIGYVYFINVYSDRLWIIDRLCQSIRYQTAIPAMR
ncbi:MULTISPECIES: hypothetical protein [Brenneria]|uniref:Uncharacterized protein n=1 Tax=Brenneria nigrifluens DSM 30175 = ATCC 13028 TaxID=1121120 RepID=A0A2U1URM1_9GAMM|nr:MULTISPECIES: hypothetical protein [Brenneria]EHD23197.1 hypothetical protein BrE312_3856 [Brenneria sp. EniD312]PWC24285.1 hypothetical protein DDT54_10570 [Brenneria nigrifluens DSM 30175 = ATCC 13028]QCR06076.1 hypothetical protein EH206_19050 [Brenneria nigrifluens DSM 30175 = ATCC 13028]